MNDIFFLHYSADHSVWTHSSYTLGVLITMPTAGGLSNAFGRKPVLVALNVLFMIGSIGCAYAQSFNQVIISRVIAGLGGGGIVLMGNVILQDIVPHEHLGTYLPFVTTSSTVCFAFGGFIGGFLTDHFGWRACFKINILPVFFTLYIYTFHFKNYPVATTSTPLSSSSPSSLSLLSQQELKSNDTLTIREKLRTVDFGGITLLSIANTCLTCTILLAGEGSFPLNSPLIISAFVSVPLFYTLFFLHQLHWASNPLVPRKMLNDRHFTVTCICGFLSGACESAALATIPQFLMGVLHFNISDSGIWLMLEAMTVPIGCFIAGRYMQHTGRFSRFLLVVTGAYAASQIILNRWILDTVSIFIGTFGVLLEGFSFGTVTITILLVVNSTLPSELAAAAMSLFLLSRNIGFLSGAASSSAIIQYNLKLLLPTRIDGPDAEKLVKFILSSIRKVYLLPPEIQDIVADVLRIALQRATYFIITASVLMFLMSTRYKNTTFIKKEQDNSVIDNDDNRPPQ
ncbi:major facilitator superfamily domain-containing protein [Phascolomyces articulosus]|uniref:Major facilitator superfamily domain-containing protein n=1 Tax=Phascolomyces articulosus TaxID=60185 RepID=A0AAD5K1E0_9FUNG|nr:major facilitator superfamily domain-containing protein [Phascolomyces articulosus]